MWPLSPKVGKNLSRAHIRNRPIRTLSIVNTQLFRGSDRDDDSLRTACLHRLIQAIIPFAHHLEHVRFANIWGDGKIDPDPAFDANQGGLELRGTDEIRSHLDQLSTQFVEAANEANVLTHDDEDDENDEDDEDDEESDTS